MVQKRIATTDCVFRTSNDFLYSFEHHFKGGTQKKDLKYPLKPSYRNHESIEIIYYEIPQYFQQIYMFASLHSSFEYPLQILIDEVNSFGLNVPRTLDILITPEVVTVDYEKFNKLPLSQRNCYLENERKLKFFKVYTQRNCEIECLSQTFLQSCDCVPFDAIRSKDTKICELIDYDCVDRVKNETLFDDNYCSCLQPCSYISYSIEATDIKHHENSTEGIIKIRFKENEIISMKRIQRFTIFDFLSYIGGLLGLFAGISVLSLFEIFYFFTLRLICEFWRLMRGQRRVGCAVD
jgi:amiloride-sensitive sodium channel